VTQVEDPCGSWVTVEPWYRYYRLCSLLHAYKDCTLYHEATADNMIHFAFAYSLWVISRALLLFGCHRGMSGYRSIFSHHQKLNNVEI
jgi:hypothetical protein